MRDGLVRGLAFVAYKGHRQHADRAKAKLFRRAAVGAGAVAGELGEFLDAFFGEHSKK